MRQDMNMDEIMEYQGRLYFMPRKEIKEKTEELLDFCGLLPFRKRTVRKLSGGMKRKLMVCRALLTVPKFFFWMNLLQEWMRSPGGRCGIFSVSSTEKILTILLTTHYMEEAQSLCNRVALMDHGKLEEIQHASGLIESLGKYTVDQELPKVPKATIFTAELMLLLFCPLWTGSVPFVKQLWKMFL